MLSFPNTYFDTYLPESASHSDGDVHCVPMVAREPVEDLSPAVVYADDGYHGIGCQVEDWVKLHSDTAFDQATGVSPRSVAQKVAYAVTFLPFADFRRELLASYQDILAQIAPLYAARGAPYHPTNDLIVLVEGGKSNKWAAELVRHNTDDTPFAYIRLGSKDAVEFAKFLEDIPKAREAAVKAQFQDKVLMLFDDGSYSGKQISDHVQAIISLIGKYKINPKAIAVVIPYMTPFALRELQVVAGNAPPGCPVLISRHNEIVTLQRLTQADPTLTDGALAQARAVEAVERALLAKMWFKGDQSILEKMGLIWGIAGTKVPNYQSFPIAIANGSIMDAKGVSIPRSISLVPDNGPCYKEEPGRPGYSIPNCHKVGVANLFRGAQPKDNGYDLLHKEGVKVIIRLREKPESNTELLDRLGIEVVHLPFDYDHPDEKLVVLFIATLMKYQKTKKFVHCYHGADRTGVMVAAAKAMQEFNKNNDEATAKANALRDMLNPVFGFHKLTHSNLIDFYMSISLTRVRDAVKEILMPSVPREGKLAAQEPKALEASGDEKGSDSLAQAAALGDS